METRTVLLGVLLLPSLIGASPKLVASDLAGGPRPQAVFDKPAAVP
jgi:hypothetical protein